MFDDDELTETTEASLKTNDDCVRELHVVPCFKPDQ